MLVPSPDEVFMIISSMTKLVKLGKNLKSHLSLSLSDAACDTLSMAGTHWSHVLHKRNTSSISGRKDKQERVLTVSILPSRILVLVWRGGGTSQRHMCHVCYCPGVGREEGGGGHVTCQMSQISNIRSRNIIHFIGNWSALITHNLQTWNLTWLDWTPSSGASLEDWPSLRWVTGTGLTNSPWYLSHADNRKIINDCFYSCHCLNNNRSVFHLLSYRRNLS